ncbi:site-specific DNA-methyltransferase [Tianweitania sediminis]|uniref:Methyltransferase n=1 Tax=Tianweitania sediminis TaxID=1502156 RepID=A0A8J7ULN6_9HYPH|nr:site-specific DNA-methyltransferase [Tianweitania sediminis]MBP0439597.1 site-specific DNA-methyltransferase [Tianweitania sediminis]
MRALSELRAYSRNSRTHSPEQIAQLAASIRQWGWTVPVLVDETGEIIAGHGRVLAARELDLQQVPCMVAAGWSDAQKRAYVIADNRLAENAGWDDDLLAEEMRAIADAGFEAGLVGFTEDELADLLNVAVAGNTDPDDVPPVPVVATSRPGDLWILGKHRIRCGDSTDADGVAHLLNGVKPHLMVTDPPYGVEYDASWRGKAKGGDGERTSLGVHATGKVLNDDRADWREAWALFPGDVAYIWHAGLFAGVVADSLLASGFTLRSQIVWKKSNFAIGRGDYHWHHEPCWYAVRGKGHWSGDRKQSTIWEIPKPQKSETGHSTQKPVDCMRRPMLNNSSPGQAVYEPFSGSGTTIIAGEMENRCVFAMELNPAYVDVAVRRWQEFTGGQATLDGDGRTFDAVALERKQAEAA